MAFFCRRKSKNVRIEAKIGQRREKNGITFEMVNGFIWRDQKSERNATLELMKYSVKGNHLNTHIVNMCCCNAINRVLITAAIFFRYTATCLRSFRYGV